MFLCRDDELAETSDAVTLVHDSATRMFWRNVNARSGNAPVNKLGRKPARYDIPADVPVPPAVELLGEVLLYLHSSCQCEVNRVRSSARSMNVLNKGLHRLNGWQPGVVSHGIDARNVYSKQVLE